MKKRFFAFLTAIISSVSTISSLPVNATANDNSYTLEIGTGGVLISPEEYSLSTGKQIIESPPDSQYNISGSKSLPTAFDISQNSLTSPYFPSVGNQGTMNSCAGWASTYYQFTYEVNKFKNEVTNSNNTYSPSWTYNYINGGANNYSRLDDAYRILLNKGAMKLADFPCGTDPATYSYNWSTDDDKMIEALNYRAKEQDPIYVYNSYSINSIKEKISNGELPLIWTDSAGWIIRQNANNEYMVIRAGNAGSGHYMCVVGYDDNIQITYNGVTLTGAFKLVNSKGPYWRNNGYIWVCYDALNLNTQYTNNMYDWEYDIDDLTRVCVFGGCNSDENEFYYNTFHFIEIKKCTPYFIGKIDYYTNNPWHLKLYGEQAQYANSIKWKVKKDFPQTGFTYCSHIFDYADIDGIPIMSSCLSSYWSVKLATTESNTTLIYYTRILDNLGANIAPTNTAFTYLNNTYNYNNYINLKKGRISSYDNSNLTSDDVTLLQSYILGNSDLSNLQMYLADMNDDDSVDIFDLVLLRQAVLSQNKGNVSYEEIMMTFIPDFNCTLEEYILLTYGESDLTYAKNLISNNI